MVEKENVRNAMKKVLDPELGIDVVALGLVYDIKISNGEVRVEMTLTSPGCPMAPQIMADAEAKVGKVKGVSKVIIEFVFDPPWNPDKMSDDARMELRI